MFPITRWSSAILPVSVAGCANADSSSYLARSRLRMLPVARAARRTTWAAAMCLPGPDVGRRVALVFCSLVIAVMAMELAMRTFLPRLPIGILMYMNAAMKDRAPRSWARVRDFVPTLNIRQEDPDTGWNHKANLRSTGRNEDGEPYDRTTSLEGFFTPDVPPPSTPQIVMLGDSFASTFYVRQPIAWVLRDAIRTPVYNLAVGGWGPESYRAAYDKYAARRRHALVVVLTFVNDISD